LTQHNWIARDEFTDQLSDTHNSTRIEKVFMADTLDDVVREFKCYLWNLSFTDVDDVVVTKTKR
jgi:hypothetical protein